MTTSLLLALIGFAAVSSMTPGPNNLMLMASGANFGLRRTVPHMLGISLGHMFMVFLVGIGLGQLLESYPALNWIMLVLSTAYLLYLAWKIATAAPPEAREATGNPFTFLQAAAFQWVNPKAWYMAIYAIANYVPDGSGWRGALLVAGVFAMTNLPSVSVWAALGTQVKRLLDRPGGLRTFNWTMAGLLVLTLYPVWFSAA
jgi:threonine/homoserine/homoserine lactone efflux protein